MTTGLDKSIPFARMVMVFPHEALSTVPQPVLPQGYRFHTYQPGDNAMWAKLETSVDEFSDEEKALAYFAKDFLPYEDLLASRMMFVLAPDGSAAGTCTAWMLPAPDGSISLAHWMCVSPDHQGKGLSRSMMQWVLRWYADHQPQGDVYLKTQTWSHKAVGLYLRMGYRTAAQSHPVLADHNDCDAACRVLKDILPEETYRQLIQFVE